MNWEARRNALGARGGALQLTGFNEAPCPLGPGSKDRGRTKAINQSLDANREPSQTGTPREPGVQDGKYGQAVRAGAVSDPGAFDALTDRAQLAEFGPAAQLARLLVVLVLAQLLLQPAPLQELLEAAEGRPDRLAV